jgi:hypothetical protein
MLRNNPQIMKRIFILCVSLFLLLASCGSSVSSDWGEAAPTAVPYAIESESGMNDSSTRISLSWNEFVEPFSHYEIDTTDVLTGKSWIESTNYSTHVFEGLKAGTTYDFSVRTCIDNSCNESMVSESVIASTAEEIWQVQGEGHGFDNATVVAENSNVLSYVLDDGEDTYKYYGKTGPGSDLRGSLYVAYLNDPEDLTSFEFATQVVKNCDLKKGDCEEGSFLVAAFQILPLMDEELSIMCLEGFFYDEDIAEHSSTTEIYCLESDDGWIAEDFDSDGLVCGDESNEFLEGGSCELEKLFGLEDGFDQARQFKIGFAKRDSWLWDQDEEAFIVITGADDCGVTNDGLFYGEWIDDEWVLERNDDNCLKPLVDYAHGPVVVHLGGNRYKLYYEERDTDTFQARKPFHMIYLDLDDDVMLETQDDAREVVFLWPDGTTLNESEEAGLGDHFISVIENDLDQQVMYMNLGGNDHVDDPGASQGVGQAILLNP